MANGEPVFEAPWQGRVFGMARALCEQGLYDWDEFRAHLIRELSVAGDEPFQYFDYFLAALAALLEEKGICGREELSDRFERFSSRPHGHDHHHD